MSMQFTSILHIDRTLTDATAPDQSGTESDGNEEVFGIPQSSSITRALPSDCLVSYLVHTLWESYPSAEILSVCCIAVI